MVGVYSTTLGLPVRRSRRASVRSRPARLEKGRGGPHGASQDALSRRLADGKTF